MSGQKLEEASIREPSGAEILRHRIYGARLAGFIRKPGWSGELPLYRFRCRIHGEVENYPQGYRDELRCPECHEAAEGLLKPSRLL